MSYYNCTCIESKIVSPTQTYGRFLLGRYVAGQALSVANGLRRSLLGLSDPVTIVGVRLANVTHEYECLPGLKECVLDMLLNLKQVVLRCDFDHHPPMTVRVSARGPTTLKAGDLKLPVGYTCANPDQVIATLSARGCLTMRLILVTGGSSVKAPAMVRPRLAHRINRRHGAPRRAPGPTPMAHHRRVPGFVPRKVRSPKPGDDRSRPLHPQMRAAPGGARTILSHTPTPTPARRRARINRLVPRRGGPLVNKWWAKRPKGIARTPLALILRRRSRPSLRLCTPLGARIDRVGRRRFHTKRRRWAGHGQPTTPLGLGGRRPPGPEPMIDAAARVKVRQRIRTSWYQRHRYNNVLRRFRSGSSRRRKAVRRFLNEQAYGRNSYQRQGTVKSSPFGITEFAGHAGHRYFSLRHGAGPVTRVNSTIVAPRSQGEQILLEVWTNGSLDPREALGRAARTHLKLFLPLQPHHSGVDRYESAYLQQIRLRGALQRHTPNLRRSLAHAYDSAPKVVHTLRSSLRFNRATTQHVRRASGGVIDADRYDNEARGYRKYVIRNRRRVLRAYRRWAKQRAHHRRRERRRNRGPGRRFRRAPSRRVAKNYRYVPRRRIERTVRILTDRLQQRRLPRHRMRVDLLNLALPWRTVMVLKRAGLNTLRDLAINPRVLRARYALSSEDLAAVRRALKGLMRRHIVGATMNPDRLAIDAMVRYTSQRNRPRAADRLYAEQPSRLAPKVSMRRAHLLKLHRLLVPIQSA